MTKQIIRTVLITLVLCILATGLMYWVWPDVQRHTAFSLFVVTTYCLLTLAICLASARYVQHENSFLFTYITLLTVLVKLVLGVAIIIAYHYIYEGDDIAYIAPFFISYVSYTVAEVMLLQRIINASKRPWKTS